jgi:formylmethanofuran dehydrogenase subunit D
MAQLNESKSSQKQIMETSINSTNAEDADMLSAEEGDSVEDTTTDMDVVSSGDATQPNNLLL